MNDANLGFKSVKVIALGATDGPRAHHFYGETLGLTPALEAGQRVGYEFGGLTLMIKDDGSLSPSIPPTSRLTVEVCSAPRTEALLREKGVTIADPVQTYDEAFLVGSFLDSEGNKIWFCSAKEPE